MPLQVCFNTLAVFYRLQVYRFLTAAIFHVGLLHVAFNMLAFIPIGASLERQLGTLQFAYLLLLFVTCGSLFFAAALFVASLLCARTLCSKRPLVLAQCLMPGILLQGSPCMVSKQQRKCLLATAVRHHEFSRRLYSVLTHAGFLSVR